MTLTPAQKVRLGVFVMSGTGILVATLLVLAGLKLWEPKIIFRARFKDNVSGLERSAPVKYQGLRVGRVEEMQIAKDDPRLIEVTLALGPDTVLYEGTQAVLDASGLTGLKTINLTPGDPRKNKLPENSVLPTGPSLFDKLADNAAAIVGDVKHVTDQLTQWATDNNRERLESLIKNLDSFVGHLDTVMLDSRVPMKALLSEVTRSTSAVGDAAEEATRTLHRVRDGVGDVEGEVVATLRAFQRPVKDVDPKEVARAVSAVRNAATTLNSRLSAEETGRALASAGATLDRVNHLIQDVDLAVRAGREDFTASLSYLRQASEDLREFSRILAQNPSVLVRGRGEGD